MYTTVGFYESIDGAGAYHKIAAIPDQHVTVFGDDVRIPRGMTKLIGQAALSGADTSLDGARIETPTLRRIINIDVGVLINGVAFGDPPESMMHPLSPTPLTEDESMNFFIDSDATGAKSEYGLVWLSDGQQSPVQGDMYTVKATGAAALSAGQWVNTALTFAQILPVGEYDIVGLRVVGANLVAARLVFVGSAWRPGVPAVNLDSDMDSKWFRYGKMGVLGRFDSTTPPTLDCLGVTNTSQDVFLDLIKIS